MWWQKKRSPASTTEEASSGQQLGVGAHRTEIEKDVVPWLEAALGKRRMDGAHNSRWSGSKQLKGDGEVWMEK
ncbi:hypothetical protein VIGAN_01213800 [Vigna angularis var. angularis]|uniref:Uncharacterized protein n=1 Tax=Vigna angularis var. angularis TaxID=157739 RepID=A0A0S3R1L5_PHAAN|nr:hypothetical protein VIGAN_01213800 [Vigna angularis var. angularis]